MASKTVIAQEIMTSFGKSDSITFTLIEQKVGEIVVDLLSQNEGRFKGLETTQVISIQENVREYKLEEDYNTSKETFYEVDSDGDFVNECNVVTKGDVHRRIKEGESVTSRMAYIKYYESNSSGTGYYLVLATDPSSDTTYEFDYYRKPTIFDADIIRNVEIIKLGVKGSFPEYNKRAEYDLMIYERRKQGFKESPQIFKPKLVVKPSRMTSRYNRRMRNIGQGG